MESYLERFWKFLLGIFLQIDWVSRAVSPGERISRFIPYRGWIRPAKGRVSPAAFMPPKIGDLSVYRTSGCAEKKIWLLGMLFVERKRKDKARVVGRADVCSDLVFEQKLKIRSLFSPHLRHAELTNWPEDKAQQKDKALALAQAAILCVRPGAEPF